MKVIVDPVAWLWLCTLVFGFVLVTRRSSAGADAPSIPRWLTRLGWTLLTLALLACGMEIANVPARLFGFAREALRFRESGHGAC